MLQKLGRAQDAQRDFREAMRLTRAHTPEQALRKISEFVHLQGR